MRQICVFFLCLFSSLAAAERVVNVYGFGGEIPQSVIQQFETETGIKVQFSTYDSNETLYTKLRATASHNRYDVIMPSAYYVERMRQQGLLQPLDHSKLTQQHVLDPFFTNQPYDPENHYSLPLIWGATGLFYPANHPLQAWRDLWAAPPHQQLMLLDDPRELFSMALMYLGYSPNDTQPKHLKQAYQALLKLVPAIQLFASEGIQAMLIDEDVRMGMAWNGDVFKAQTENTTLQFAYPEEGFVIWIDCLAIPKHAPHLEAAYAWINFLLTPRVAAEIARQEGFGITNAKGRALLPKALRNNPMIYPDATTMQRAQVQRDVTDEALRWYNEYWLRLKLSF